MIKWTFTLFIIAFGFVTSALVYACRGLFRTLQPAGGPSTTSPAKAVMNFAFYMITGPWLVLNNSFSFWRHGNIRLSTLFLCVLLVVLWSFCSGIFVVQFLVLAGAVIA